MPETQEQLLARMKMLAANSGSQKIREMALKECLRLVVELRTKGLRQKFEDRVKIKNGLPVTATEAELMANLGAKDPNPPLVRKLHNGEQLIPEEIEEAQGELTPDQFDETLPAEQRNRLSSLLDRTTKADLPIVDLINTPVKVYKNMMIVPPENLSKYLAYRRLRDRAPELVKPIIQKAMDSLFTVEIPEVVVIESPRRTT